MAIPRAASYPTGLFPLVYILRFTPAGRDESEREWPVAPAAIERVHSRKDCEGPRAARPSVSLAGWRPSP